MLCLLCSLQPTDLSDPNPVQILMLCVHLFERLPQYLPLQTMELSGGLHATFSKRVPKHDAGVKFELADDSDPL